MNLADIWDRGKHVLNREKYNCESLVEVHCWQLACLKKNKVAKDNWSRVIRNGNVKR